MSDALKVGDRFRISFELMEQMVVEEVLRRTFKPEAQIREVRLAAVRDLPDGAKELLLTNVDDEGAKLSGWPQ